MQPATLTSLIQLTAVTLLLLFGAAFVSAATHVSEGRSLKEWRPWHGMSLRAIALRRAKRATVRPTENGIAAVPAAPLVVVGDLRVRDRATVPELLLVEGDLTVEAGARFDATAHVKGNVRLEERSEVTRTLIIDGRLEMRTDARLAHAQVKGSATLAHTACVEGSLDCDMLYLDDPTTPRREVPIVANEAPTTHA